MTIEAPRILIISASASDIEVFRELLFDDFPVVQSCMEPSQFADAFARYKPEVLILAMHSVAESEQHYLEITRHVGKCVPAPYKTLLLCGKEDVKRAFELCRTSYFDDYILFWPMVHDASRLAMSVHHALRFMEATRSAASLPDLHLQARRIASLGETLDTTCAAGHAHLGQAREAIEAIGTSIRDALEAFGRRMIDTGLNEALVVKNIARVMRALEDFDRESVEPPVAAALRAAAPLEQWIEELPKRLDSQLAASRSLSEQVATLRPVILVIDDDEFMLKVLARVLGTAGYRVEAVNTAAKAVAFLRGRQPDLILMDVKLPDIDGIVLTKQLKAADAYMDIPIIMLTGQGQKQVLANSRGAGANDFVVKPFDRDKLLQKIAHHLSIPFDG